MKIPNVSGLAKVGKTFVLANRPEILFGTSIVATLASVVLSARGGYEARGIVDKAENLRALEGNDTPLTSKEKIQLTWLCYMPAAITTITAIGSTTGLHIVHVKDKKMMAQAGLAALEEVKTAAKQYEADVKESIEENASVKVGDKIENGIDEKQKARMVEGGMYTVQDAYTGRPFFGTESKTQEAVNAVNELMNNKNSSGVDLNYFYIQAGFPEIDRGEEFGWSGQNLRLEWEDTHLEDGRPARKFKFNPQPRKGYDSLSQ